VHRAIAFFGFLIAALAQDRVDPTIAIADIKGQLQHPFQVAGKSASVIFFITNDCPISNAYAREIRRICEASAGRASCFLNYVDPDLTAKLAAKHAADYGHGDYPAFVDKKHLLVRAAGATVTPEAVIVAAGGKIAYRGRIDNQYVTWGTRRPEPTERDLRTALDAVLQGRPVATPRTKAVGCFITPLHLLGK
jgi:hypothetical protein